MTYAATLMVFGISSIGLKVALKNTSSNKKRGLSKLLKVKVGEASKHASSLPVLAVCTIKPYQS